MGQMECCKKTTPLDEELNQIFASSPEDNKIPNDNSYLGNYGGEYPQDNDLPPRFPYEARYPTRRVEAPPSLKENATRRTNKYRRQIPSNNMDYYNPLEEKYSPDSKEYIEQLYIRCEAYGQVRNIDEFNFDKLSAPPLAMFFTPQDIWELNGIAKSIRLSGKLQEKLRLIDNILCLFGSAR